MIKLLEIDGLDYTRYVNRKNYQVNHSDLCKEWRDINMTKHREIIRREIGGSLQLTFLAENLHGLTARSGEFITTQSDGVFTLQGEQGAQDGSWEDWQGIANSPGVHTMNIYVNSLDEVVSLNGFIEYTARAVRMNKGAGEEVGAIVVDCKVTER